MRSSNSEKGGLFSRPEATEKPKTSKKGFTRVDSTEKVKEVKNDSIFKRVLKGALIPLLIAGFLTVFLFILINRNKDEEILKTTVVVAKMEIPENTYINMEETDTYFMEISLPKEGVSDNTYRLLSDFPTEGFYVENAMCTNQMVLMDDIASKDMVMDKYKKNHQVTSISVNSFDKGVNGTIRKGDIIDVYAVDEATEELTLMAKDVYVAAAFDNSGEEIVGEGIAVSYNIYVTPTEIRDINQAICWGGLQIYLK